MEKINKKKVSQLPEAKSIDGFYAFGTDKNDNSVKVPLELLKGNKGDTGDQGEKGDDGNSVANKTIFNISQYNNKYDYPDLATARNAVPSDLRGIGQIITCMMGNGSWMTEQFVGKDVSDWEMPANWESRGNVKNPVYSTKELLGTSINWSSYAYEGTNWMDTSGKWSTGATVTSNKYILKVPVNNGTYKIKADIIKLGNNLQKTIFIHSSSGTLQTKYIVSSFPHNIVIPNSGFITILESLYNNTTSSYEHQLSNIKITKDVEKNTFTDGAVSIDIENLNNVIENLKTDHPLKGKRISILADSISAYTDSIPVGNSGWYPKNDVTSVNSMWWKRLITETGAILDTNDSWGGAAISNHNPVAGSDSPYVSDLRINRLGTPDIIFVFGGTNDFGSVHTPLGGYNFGNTQDISEFKQAVTYLFQKLMTTYPFSKIICLTPILRSDNKGIPAKDSGKFLFEFSDILIHVANIYGIKVIDLLKCGINYGNASSYLYDGIHPNANGMKLLSDFLIKETLNI